MIAKRLYSLLIPAKIDRLLFSAADVPDEPLASNPAALFRRFHRGAPSGIKTIDRRLSQKRECYVCEIKGEIVHHSWLLYDVLLPRRFGFDAEVPVIGDCLTVEQYRGRGIYPTMLRHIVLDVQTRLGLREVYILVGPSNKGSIRGIEKAGFRCLGRLRGLRLAGLVLNRQLDPLDMENSQPSVQ